MLMVYMITMMLNKLKNLFAFKAAYEIEYLFEKYEAFDDDGYRPENLAILGYFYENYEYKTILMHL